VFPSRAALELGGFVARQETRKALTTVPGGECRARFSGRAKVRQRSIVTWQHHETEEDRDAQDRAGRPSAVATRRPAQTARRPERQEDRTACRNELRRADRLSPQAPEHSLQREARQRQRVRPCEATSTLPTFYWIGAWNVSSCSVRMWLGASASATCLFWQRYAFMDGGSCSFRILLSQSVVERTTKRTTRSTTSAAVPTGRGGSGWIPKEWTFHSDAVADKFAGTSANSSRGAAS
jgi:hypothetical protein